MNDLTAMSHKHPGPWACQGSFCMYLLVEDHVYAMWSDIMCKLAQEGEDVFYARCVRQPP